MREYIIGASVLGSFFLLHLTVRETLKLKRELYMLQALTLFLKEAGSLMMYMDQNK